MRWTRLIQHIEQLKLESQRQNPKQELQEVKNCNLSLSTYILILSFVSAFTEKRRKAKSE